MTSAILFCAGIFILAVHSFYFMIRYYHIKIEADLAEEALSQCMAKLEQIRMRYELSIQDDDAIRKLINTGTF